MSLIVNPDHPPNDVEEAMTYFLHKGLRPYLKNGELALRGNHNAVTQADKDYLRDNRAGLIAELTKAPISPPPPVQGTLDSSPGNASQAAGPEKPLEMHEQFPSQPSPPGDIASPTTPEAQPICTHGELADVVMGALVRLSIVLQRLRHRDCDENTVIMLQQVVESLADGKPLPEMEKEQPPTCNHTQLIANTVDQLDFLYGALRVSGLDGVKFGMIAEIRHSLADGITKPLSTIVRQKLQEFGACPGPLEAITENQANGIHAKTQFRHSL